MIKIPIQFSIFLHSRSLCNLYRQPKESNLFKIIALLNIATFMLFRIAVSLVLIGWLISEYIKWTMEWYLLLVNTVVICSLSTTNLVLCYRVLAADGLLGASRARRHQPKDDHHHHHHQSGTSLTAHHHHHDQAAQQQQQLSSDDDMSSSTSEDEQKMVANKLSSSSDHGDAMVGKTIKVTVEEQPPEEDDEAEGGETEEEKQKLNRVVVVVQNGKAVGKESFTHSK